MNEFLTDELLSKTVNDGEKPIAIAQFVAAPIVLRLPEVQRDVADILSQETNAIASFQDFRVETRSPVVTLGFMHWFVGRKLRQDIYRFPLGRTREYDWAFF